ncbi:MAG: hypothetical protein WCC30_09850 [Candidatus Dormiibacterota bacterium]
MNNPVAVRREPERAVREADGLGTTRVVGQRARRLPASVLGMIYLLVIQFVLGVAVNLFVTISPSPDGFWWPVVQGPAAVLIVHVLVGVLLVINSIVVLVHAFRMSDKAPRLIAGLGLAAVLAAAISGRVFLGNTQNVASFAMAIGFGVAVVAYSQLLYALRVGRA